MIYTGCHGRVRCRMIYDCMYTCIHAYTGNLQGEVCLRAVGRAQDAKHKVSISLRMMLVQEVRRVHDPHASYTLSSIRCPIFTLALSLTSRTAILVLGRAANQAPTPLHPPPNHLLTVQSHSSSSRSLNSPFLIPTLPFLLPLSPPLAPLLSSSPSLLSPSPSTCKPLSLNAPFSVI